VPKGTQSFAQRNITPTNLLKCTVKTGGEMAFKAILARLTGLDSGADVVTGEIGSPPPTPPQIEA
jgi:hypothetical protein